MRTWYMPRHMRPMFDQIFELNINLACVIASVPDPRGGKEAPLWNVRADIDMQTARALPR